MMLGGGMRQASVLAAAGLVVVCDGIAWLEKDHRAARRLAQRLARLPGLAVDVRAVETNIVLCRIEEPELSSEWLCDCLLERGIACSAPNPAVLRFVVHHRVAIRRPPSCCDSSSTIRSATARWTA